MLIASFPAGPWQANCFLVAAGPGAECLILDPGVDAADDVRSVVAEHRLRPVAVIASHGHLDHTYSVAELCAAYEVPCWINGADRDLLADPFAAMPPGVDTMLGEAGYRTEFVEPDRVETLADGDRPTLAGFELTVVAAPGHTPGSMLLRTPYQDPGPATGGEPITELIFSGDVLFAGSIGRTDLPRGNPANMLETLRTTMAGLPDSAAVLPGHGSQTTMARERAANPYLQPDYLHQEVEEPS
ncbi:MBL fold metallo-hydrolase [Microlunatus speluncae]|uniref:MBL fold metallo-hydrolase n=1 Tax=Microlunatus speluncae TaxID=2594267 RepID=UPI00126663A8|nr:MBL fold metallo-hydrolase [Microlunatus speluncae]